MRKLTAECAAMAGPSAYNERFLLPDPLDEFAGSRTTRYRYKKRSREEGSSSVITGEEDAACYQETDELPEETANTIAIDGNDDDEEFFILFERTAFLQELEMGELEMGGLETIDHDTEEDELPTDDVVSDLDTATL